MPHQQIRRSPSTRSRAYVQVRPLQMHITMGGTSLLALIDSGSTHNFVTEEAVGHTNLPTLTQGHLRVTVANGERVQCPGVFRNTPFSINKEEFLADFYALPLASYDIALGTQWLATLGPELWDFGALTMSFWRGVASSAGAARRPPQGPRSSPASP